MTSIGWLQLKGSNPRSISKSLQVRIKQEGTRTSPKWYTYITYAVPQFAVNPGAVQGMLGLDRNVSQATDRPYHMMDQSRVEAKIRRKRRAQRPASRTW